MSYGCTSLQWMCAVTLNLLLNVCNWPLYLNTQKLTGKKYIYMKGLNSAQVACGIKKLLVKKISGAYAEYLDNIWY